MLQIPAKGSEQETVLNQLAEFRRGDVDWRDGKTFAYVFQASEAATAVAERAYRMFLWENALDPTVFPSMLELETRIVSMAASHLGGDDDVVGSFTSGGTESVLLAVKTARDYARSRNPALARGQIVLPETAHPCFHKACAYFELDAVVVPVDPVTYQADVASVRAAITESTILLVGSAPSYAHGVIDPIAELGELALEFDVLLHVDGCIGAFLLPFLRDCDPAVAAVQPAFDFRVPGVTSISMDFHKYAYAPKGASVVLYRNASLRRHQIFTWSAWPGYSMINPTIQSSKSGGPLAATFAVLNFLGRQGYSEIAQTLLETRDAVVAGIREIEGLRVLGEPAMTLIAVGADGINLFRLCDEMKRRGWTMHPQMRLGALEESFHLTLMPTNAPHIEQWVADLRESVRVVRDGESEQTSSVLEQAFSAIDFDKLDDGQVEQLLELAGLGGGALPGGEMAEINQILNGLPAAVTDRLLTAYYNSLSRYRDAR